MKRFFWIFFLLPNLLWAQGEATMLFLLTPPSPSLNGMGAVGTALPSDDPFAFHFNPAQLGQTRQFTNLSVHFYPGKVNWVPVFPGPITTNNFALNLGYKFKKTFLRSPLKIGFGYMYSEFDYGSGDFYSNGYLYRYEAKESYRAFSFALGLNYNFDIALGVTYKPAKSRFGQIRVGSGQEISEKEVSVIDLGALVNFPIFKAAENPASTTGIQPPVLNLSLGYSKLNIGDEVTYFDNNPGDPLPRTARLGYGVRAGVPFLLTNGDPLELIGIDWAIEAEDILVTRKGENFEYQFLLGDIDIWKNIIQARGTDKVVSRMGFRFRFAEIFSCSYGHFEGRGYESLDTYGFGFSASGILKLWNSNSPAKISRILSKHFDLQFHNSMYFAGHDFETCFQGISVIIGGF